MMVSMHHSGLAEVLLDLLNTTPVVDGRWLIGSPTTPAARRGCAPRGGRRRMSTPRGPHVTTCNAWSGWSRRVGVRRYLADVRQVPDITTRLVAGGRLALSARAGLGRAGKDMPGRLRPCANDECRLFLIDRSRRNRPLVLDGGCGNRMRRAAMIAGPAETENYVWWSKPAGRLNNSRCCSSSSPRPARRWPRGCPPAQQPSCPNTVGRRHQRYGRSVVSEGLPVEHPGPARGHG